MLFLRIIDSTVVRPSNNGFAKKPQNFSLEGVDPVRNPKNQARGNSLFNLETAVFSEKTRIIGFIIGRG
jgi:hypothetical protein